MTMLIGTFHQSFIFVAAGGYESILNASNWKIPDVFNGGSCNPRESSQTREIAANKCRDLQVSDDFSQKIQNLRIFFFKSVTL